MKLAAISVLALLAATPVLAQTSPGMDKSASEETKAADSATSVVPPSQNPNVDDRTAAADAARQREYQDKLDAANAQAKADSAVADRDAAQAQADQDRAEKHAAEGQSPQ
jgi:hypothetical protein